MKSSRIVILSTIVLTILFVASILHAEDSNNLLCNPGFEDGITGWQSSGGTLTYTNNPVHAGNRAAILIANEAEAYIYQIVYVSPEASYTFGGWVIKNSIYKGAISLQISWYESENGSGNEINRNESNSFTDNSLDYHFLTTGTLIAPPNAHSAKVKGMVRLANPGQPVSVFFDDMTFVEVPPPPTCAPNLLLTNPGFEEGTANWSTYGGTLSLIESPAQSGAHAVALNSDTINAIWIYQTVSIQGGENYTFCGYSLKNDPNIERVFLRTSWYESEDGFGTEISHSDSLATLTDDQPQYRLLTTSEVTAPSNARSARVKAMVVPHSATPATVYFDDFSFIGPAFAPSPTPTVTPAPTPTPTPTLEPSPTPTPTLMPTPAPSPTPTPTHTPKPTPRPTPTRTPSPSPPPTLTPTPSLAPTPTTTSPFLSTPTPTAITPTPDFTPKLTPMPNITTSPSASQAQPWIHTRIPAFLFLIGLSLFAAVFWLKRQG